MAASLLVALPAFAQTPASDSDGASALQAEPVNPEAPTLDSPSPDAGREVTRNRLPFVRLAAGAGVGWAREQGTGPAARVSAARLSAEYVHLPGLVLGVDAELWRQDRTYMTTLPALDQPGPLELSEDETRLRVSIAGGWDALGSWVVSEDRSVGLLPQLVVSLDQFNNDAVPHTSLELGGGFGGFLRLADRLRLQTELAYQYSLELGDPVVKERLLYGVPISLLRYEVAAVVEVSPRAGLHVGYAGEWLTHQHSDRFANTLLLGVIFDI